MSEADLMCGKNKVIPHKYLLTTQVLSVQIDQAGME